VGTFYFDLEVQTNEPTKKIAYLKTDFDASKTRLLKKA
jgi:hypothetical protein